MTKPKPETMWMAFLIKKKSKIPLPFTCRLQKNQVSEYMEYQTSYFREEYIIEKVTVTITPVKKRGKG